MHCHEVMAHSLFYILMSTVEKILEKIFLNDEDHNQWTELNNFNWDDKTIYREQGALTAWAQLVLYFVRNLKIYLLYFCPTQHQTGLGDSAK